MLVALYQVASPVSIFRRVRLRQRVHTEVKILVPYCRIQTASSLPNKTSNKNVSVVRCTSRSIALPVQRLGSGNLRPLVSFSTLTRPSDQTMSETITCTISDDLLEVNSIDESCDENSTALHRDDDWWAGIENVNSRFSGEAYNDGTNDSAEKSKGTKPFSETRRISTPPDTTIYHRSKPTFFQWDYRNHREIEGPSYSNLLRKIEEILKGAHLEPFGKRRGVITVRRNLLAFDPGSQFRLAQTKSFIKKKRTETFRNGSKIPSRKIKKRRINRLLRTGRLRETMFRLLYERHAIYSCRHTAEIGALDRYALGESFFGPTTHIAMTARIAKLIIKELWLYGHSRIFSRLQNNHNFYQVMLKRRIRAEWLNQ